MNGTGEILSNTSIPGETSAALERELRSIKSRCDELHVDYPTYFICDDAKCWENTVKKVFKDAKVQQDLKHLINRCIEVVGASKPGAASFSKDFHKAFTTDDDMVVRSRNNSKHKVKAPLDPPEIIIARAEKVIRNYRDVYPTLLSAEFQAVWENQKPQIHAYVADPIVDGNPII
jgi:hypothetical protein